MDDALEQCLDAEPLRQRDPSPTLADSEVLTMEVVGEYLGLSQDKAIFCYFRRHYPHFFPALAHVHRTTFTRQGANLWLVKERLWPHFLMLTDHDEQLALVDSFPLPVCRFARARQCKRFRDISAFGKDVIARQTFYGMRVHARVCWPGVITRLEVAPANVSELAVLPDLTEQTEGLVLGNRNYWSPKTKAALAQTGIVLVAPYQHRSVDREAHSDPERTRTLSRVRYRIDTVFGQLVERYSIKRIWAKDWWHLASRLLRQVLGHTICFLLNQLHGNAPLRLGELVTY